MSKIKTTDILPWKEYERARLNQIKKIAEIKSKRRFELGDRLTLLFENRDTVLHQVQEMVYLDRLENETDIQHEIDVYSSLLPCGGKIKVTLYINAYDVNDLKKVFKELKGIYNSVFLKIGGKLIQGIPEAGREQGDEFSTVQYLTFDLEGEKSTDIEIIVLHENYKVNMKVPKELAEELIKEAYDEC